MAESGVFYKYVMEGVSDAGFYISGFVGGVLRVVVRKEERSWMGCCRCRRLEGVKYGRSQLPSDCECETLRRVDRAGMPIGGGC